MRNYLTFNGHDSRDYGVYISGQGTFSAPARAYEMLSVPGRNGDLVGYEKRLENIEVTYPCFIYSNFDQNLSNFRNMLLSTFGYVKLTDSYHTDEFRMALFQGPFDPEVTKKNDAGSFDLTFICKPQRFLNSGETVTTFDITNPAGAITDNTPYLLRASGGGLTIGNREWDKLVGGTVAWNQLVANGNFATSANWQASANASFSITENGEGVLTTTNTGTTIKRIGQVIPFIAGHKYLFLLEAKSSTPVDFQAYCGSGGSIIPFITASGIESTYQTISAIVKAGSTSNSGTFVLGTRTAAPSGGSIVMTFKNVHLHDLTAMFGSTIADYAYTLEQNEAGSGIAWLKSYGFFTEDYYAHQAGKLESVNASAHVMRDADDNIIGNYALDSSLTLRGIPKLDANNKLYYDGDTYEADGTVTRKYGTRAYQSGDESLADAITDGANTVYKLTIPTTESATGYTNPQVVDPDGTEQYTDAGVAAGTRDVGIPVGHESVYFDYPFTLDNPTLWNSQPLIRAYGAGSFGINSDTVTISTADVYTDIDCEMMDCFKGTANKNANVSFSGYDFPTLKLGENNFTMTGITKLEITPRWWKV